MVKREEVGAMVKEKVLLVGNAGTGKTYAGVKVAGALSVAGFRVIYVDCEFGSQREMLRLSDPELDNIILRVTANWPDFKDAVMFSTGCDVKIVDGLSEALELFQRHVEAKYVAQGFYRVAEKQFEIKDPDTFRLPWNEWAKCYDEVRNAVFQMLQQRCHLLVTMHHIGESDAKQRLQEDIYRKFDTVLEMRRTEKDTPAWYAVIKKNRGREDTQTGIQVRNVVEALTGMFKKWGDAK